MAVPIVVAVYEEDRPRGYQFVLSNNLHTPIQVAVAIDGTTVYDGNITGWGGFIHNGTDPWYINDCIEHSIVVITNLSSPNWDGRWSGGIGDCPGQHTVLKEFTSQLQW
ncbi:MAG: hypothetical protein L3K09_00425 [Thermoplasmata archaeon]|nr:hypothetical protein [Thermoplasmata archaeon]